MEYRRSVQFIRDEKDFKSHGEYIHYNPVKQGLVRDPKDWEYSSFHLYVEKGIYEREWGASTSIRFASIIGMERNYIRCRVSSLNPTYAASLK